MTSDNVITGAVDCLSLAIHNVLTELSLRFLLFPPFPRDPIAFSFSVSLPSVCDCAGLPENMNDVSDRISGEVLLLVPQDGRLNLDVVLSLDVDDDVKADATKLGVEEWFDCL